MRGGCESIGCAPALLARRGRLPPFRCATRICGKLELGEADKMAETNVLQWYQELARWHLIIKKVELHVVYNRHQPPRRTSRSGA
jgi:hypothetical protein